ncbi:MAG TPA: molybdopterin-dependent oxidoreductase, partial [Spirochaetia bacterium]|nr:molybdopterin-dependent oxidoreductase [Spirochaetia bacterium]
REMDPANVDASDLPLDPISSLHVTGAPMDVDPASWRLSLSGAGLTSPTALTYQDLQGMPTVARRAILICPGVFADYAEWEGVPLDAVLAKAGLSASWSKVSFVAMDGYREEFTRGEVQTHLLFLALKVNGQVLPRDHGFPIRLVAVDLYGGRWVKWIKEIRVE